MPTIQTNNTNLQTILDVVQALPDKVEATTYETCMLSIWNNYGFVQCVKVMRIIDNEIVTEEITNIPIDVSSSYDIENIIKNSLIYIQLSQTLSNDLLFSSGMEILCNANGNVIAKPNSDYCSIAPSAS